LNERVQKGSHNPDNVIHNRDRLPAPDTSLLTEHPEVAEQFRDSQIESVRNGVRGAAYEWQLYTRPWGFRLDAITMAVHLWYGAEDVNVPPAMGRYLASQLPNSHLTTLPKEAHLSLINNHIDDILKTNVP
jgi:pimeloyl-ACP methyl ester carboxylesterase